MCGWCWNREESRVFFHSWRLVLTGKHLYSCVCKVRASCGPFLGSKCFSYLSSFRKQADLNPHWHCRKPRKGFEGAQCVTLKFQAGSCPSLGALTAKWLISMPQSAQGKHHLPCSPGACQSSIGMGSTCSTGCLGHSPMHCLSPSHGDSGARPGPGWSGNFPTALACVELPAMALEIDLWFVPVINFGKCSAILLKIFLCSFLFLFLLILPLCAYCTFCNCPIALGFVFCS